MTFGPTLALITDSLFELLREPQFGSVARVRLLHECLKLLYLFRLRDELLIPLLFSRTQCTGDSLEFGCNFDDRIQYAIKFIPR